MMQIRSPYKYHIRPYDTIFTTSFVLAAIANKSRLLALRPVCYIEQLNQSLFEF